MNSILVIKFATPVNKKLKKQVEDIGGKILQPLSRLEIIVSVSSNDVANQIRDFEEVRQVIPYSPRISVKSNLLKYLGQPATKKAIADARLNAAKNPPRLDRSNVTFPGIFIANFFTSADRDLAAKNLENQGIRIANSPGKTKLIVDLNSDINALESFQKITKQQGLQSLAEKTVPKSI